MCLESVIVLLSKAKSRFDTVNYCPISLTSVCCKIMKKIVISELVLYFKSNCLISDRQFSFRKFRSTKDQMLLVHSEIAELVDDCLVVDMIMLNFAKAFDVVSDILLLDKLRNVAFSATLLSRIWDFLQIGT